MRFGAFQRSIIGTGIMSWSKPPVCSRDRSMQCPVLLGKADRNLHSHLVDSGTFLQFAERDGARRCTHSHGSVNASVR